MPKNEIMTSTKEIVHCETCGKPISYGVIVGIPRIPVGDVIAYSQS